MKFSLLTPCLAFALTPCLSGLAPAAESPGPSSRRTPLAITEIHYHPPSRTDGRELEFVEIYNSGPLAEDLSNHRLSGSVDYRFPANTRLAAGGYLVVAKAPADLTIVAGITNVVGPFTNSLPNDTGTVRLRNELDALLLEVPYDSRPPWPVAPDGTGHSLVLARPSYGEASPQAWSQSDAVGGSPGGPDPATPDVLDDLCLNELLTHTDPPQEDFIELYNHGNVARDLSGAWLGDHPTTAQFRVPDGTVIPARGCIAFGQSQLGFALAAEGERVFLWNSNRTKVLDAVWSGPQENGVTLGRVPDGGEELVRLATPTPGTNNDAALPCPVVINELMFQPISGNDDDQFVELFNRSTNRVDLGGWRLTSGVDFLFPSPTVLAPGGYVVIARNAARLRTNYAQLNLTNCLGDFGGRLSHAGERLALAMPHSDTITTNGQTITNTMFIEVQALTYGDGGRWGDWSSGGGSSLELADPHAEPRFAANWADSDETAKAPWTSFEYTGPLGETASGSGVVINDCLHVFLLGIGECLVDDLEVRTNGSANLLLNPGFESGLANWFPQGSFDQSTVGTGGVSGSLALRLRGGSRGDTAVNRVRSANFSTITSSASVTLRGKARWLRGWPELLLRVQGGGIEAFGRLNVPANPGTPGLPNSRLVTNAGPAIYNVTHTPVLPMVGQSVLVTAQVDDPDGLQSVVLRRRQDPSTSVSDVLLRDDGLGGDAVAGDGIYTTTLPGMAANSQINFHLRATDKLGALKTFPAATAPDASSPRMFPFDSFARECLVRWGQSVKPGNFATYHLWLSQINRDRWTNRDNLNNTPVDGTFVYRNERVIYNAGALFSGSPFHRGQMTTGPDGANRCDYIVRMPADDAVLGETDFNLALAGNGSGGSSSDLSTMAEQISFLIFRALGVPHLHRRYIHLYVNGTLRSTVSSLTGNFPYEDTQQPNAAYLRGWFPDDPDGALYKIEDWMEFNDTGTSFVNNDADLTRRLVPGTTNLNLAAYRYMFQPRSVPAGGSANDYSAIADLVNALSPTTDAYAALNLPLVNDRADVDQWVREMACQRTVGNFDSYGWDRGKNNYFYRPASGRTQLLPWDVDWAMGTGIGRPAGASIWGGSDPRAGVLLNTPSVSRRYLQAFREILDGPMRAGVLEGAMNERAAALLAGGFTFDATTFNISKTYIANRRVSLEQQLAVVQTNFLVLSATNFTAASNLITIIGEAPLEAATLAINGQPWAVTWLTATRWSLTLALPAGTNQFALTAWDRLGAALANATRPFTVIVPGSTPSPMGSIVLHELLHRPAVSNATFVELRNIHPTAAFDLGGWRLNGLDYTFPPGSVIQSGGFLVLAEDRWAFAQAYGTNVVPFDAFSGKLDPDGETLSLLKPGALPGSEQLVDRVRYEAAAPWPMTPAGASLQLVDAAQDNSRVASWAVGQTNPPPPAPQWVYYSTNGTSTGSRLYIYLESSGDIYVDDLSLVAGTTPGSGVNLLANPGFESALSGTWTSTANFSQSALSTAVKHSGSASLHVIATAAGSGSGNAIYQDISPALTGGAPYALGFWYLQSANGGPLVVRLTNYGITARADPAPPVTVATALLTPGATNSVAASLPAFPTVWLNEIQPENLNGPLDNFSQREPWVELHNAGTSAVSLAGCFLSDTFTNLTRWPFPTNASIAPQSFLVVWCDAQTTQSTSAALHSNFRPLTTSGRLALARTNAGGAQLLDYLTYTNVPANWTHGAVPDGQPFCRDRLFHATPGATNDPSAAPLKVFINEWLADNFLTLADPADGQFEDWFELYNAGDTPADLGGCYLSDTLANPTKSPIPNTGRYVIPPKGTLLVWADDETSQNSTNRADLHAAFKLDKAGEAIALFASEGTLVDAVVFGAQATDRSEGRFPDGGANRFPLAQPTPRAANLLLNTAPVLAVLPPVYVHVGEVATATATATDAEAAVQTLSFSLLPGAPAGASLDPATGGFTWHTRNATAPSTHHISFQVSDNGTPPLSAVGSLSVIVSALPQLGAASSAGDGLIHLTFATLAGRNYRVEFKNRLGAVTWQPLGNTLAGNGGVLELTDLPGAQPHRFYRVTALPPASN